MTMKIRAIIECIIMALVWAGLIIIFIALGPQLALHEWYIWPFWIAFYGYMTYFIVWKDVKRAWKKKS